MNGSDTGAYVMNYVSRDVSVIDLTGSPETVTATIRSTALPIAGTLADTIHIGKELYNTSIGEFDPAPLTTTPITGRMSNNGWGACSACHTPFGTSDNVVWIFPSGPKRTLPQTPTSTKLSPTGASATAELVRRRDGERISNSTFARSQAAWNDHARRRSHQDPM